MHSLKLTVPLKIGLNAPKGNEKVFQASIFRGELLVSRRASVIRLWLGVKVSIFLRWCFIIYQNTKRSWLGEYVIICLTSFLRSKSQFKVTFFRWVLMRNCQVAMPHELVVSIIFYVHLYLGKWSNLRSIFFRWVGSTTNQHICAKDCCCLVSKTRIPNSYSDGTRSSSEPAALFWSSHLVSYDGRLAWSAKELLFPSDHGLDPPK